jgi:hypothetical protein
LIFPRDDQCLSQCSKAFMVELILLIFILDL